MSFRSFIIIVVCLAFMASLGESSPTTNNQNDVQQQPELVGLTITQENINQYAQALGFPSEQSVLSYEFKLTDPLEEKFVLDGGGLRTNSLSVTQAHQASRIIMTAMGGRMPLGNPMLTFKSYKWSARTVTAEQKEVVELYQADHPATARFTLWTNENGETHGEGVMK